MNDSNGTSMSAHLMEAVIKREERRIQKVSYVIQSLMSSKNKIKDSSMSSSVRLKDKKSPRHATSPMKEMKEENRTIG